jgi:hypothetical protein
VGKGASRRAHHLSATLKEAVGTRSLSSGARARDPVALPTLRTDHEGLAHAAYSDLIQRSVLRGRLDAWTVQKLLD